MEQPTVLSHREAALSKWLIQWLILQVEPSTRKFAIPTTVLAIQALATIR